MSSTSKYFQGKTSNRRATRQTSPTPEHSKMDNMLSEMGKIASTLQTVATDVSSIKETVTDLKNSVSSIQVRLDEAEERISTVEDAASRLTEESRRADERLDTLYNRIEELENMNRRNNVRLIGLTEELETDGLVNCVQQLISEGLGIELDGEFEIEGTYRVGKREAKKATRAADNHDEDKPPRTVLIKFLRTSARDKILQAAKEKGSIEWRDCRVSFFPDMSRDRAKKRREFTASRKMLHKLNVRFTFALPASLRFTWNGKERSFTSSKEAEKFIRERCGGSTD